MDKLERYLDQVCRGIGGPRSLRQHVRQELREHLTDAAAEHRAAGLSPEEALDRAIADFGGPEEVRSELEATHGHSVMAVVIEKAMQWKEMTMRAKWLWTTWAYLAAAGVIAVEVMWITFAAMYLVPRFQKLMLDGVVDPAALDEHGVGWMVSFLNTLMAVTDKYTTFLILGAAAAWGLFEWRVRSDNKPFMRLAALGTAAVALSMVSVLTAGSMIISFTMALPATGKITRPFTLQHIATIDTSVATIEQALAKKEWAAMSDPAAKAQNGVNVLVNVATAMPSLTVRSDRAEVEGLRADMKAARDAFDGVAKAIKEKDAAGLTAALKKFGEAYKPIQEAAKRPVR
jgi:hypothetical protein